MNYPSKDLKVLTLILVFSAIPCFGYIDPGMGAFLWQTIIAISVGAVFHVMRLLKFVSKKTSEEAPTKESHGSDEKQPITVNAA